MKMISSKDFAVGNKGVSGFISYTKGVKQEYWKKGKEVPFENHPRLDTLTYKGKGCPNEVWFIDEDCGIIVILAMPHDDITSHIIALDTTTRKLHTTAIWLNEDAEWDDFSTHANEVVVRMFL